MKFELFDYPDGKTNYQIVNEHNEKTTITLDKWVADILQVELSDVHEKIQIAYNKTLMNKPGLGRRERGNLIRQMAINTANKYQETKRELLGWNDNDLLSLL